MLALSMSALGAKADMTNRSLPTSIYEFVSWRRACQRKGVQT